MTDVNTHYLLGRYSPQFAPQSDYIAAFRASIDDLYALGGTTQERLDSVSTLTKLYISQTGERPNHNQLDRMATFILLADKAELIEAAKAEKLERLGAA